MDQDRVESAEPANREKSESAISGLYKLAKLREPKWIISVGSPIVGALFRMRAGIVEREASGGGNGGGIGGGIGGEIGGEHRRWNRPVEIRRLESAVRIGGGIGG